MYLSEHRPLQLQAYYMLSEHVISLIVHIHVHDYISETHQTKQGNTTPPTETAHFLLFSKKK